MGLSFTKWLDDWYKSLTGPSTILILGLDNAGKTMVLYCMKLKTSIQHDQQALLLVGLIIDL